jgi:hypothetical protein
MSRSIPKTGLAGRMRAWMSGREGRFALRELYEALGIPPGLPRERAARDLRDFVRRGEVIRDNDGRCNGNRYRYVGMSVKPAAGLRARILKAMYLSSRFALSDIVRLSGAPDRNYVHKIARPLRKGGYIQAVGRRLCAHGAGAEAVYYIPDRDRFRLEVIG